jgi:Uncharacterised nucleotidyltransferase
MLCWSGVNSTASGDRSVLLTLLRAVEQPEVAASLAASDPRIVAVARYHRLSPLLSVVCARTLPGPLAETFRRDRTMAMARAMLLEQAAEECIAALNVEGIPTIVLKGLAYDRCLYGGQGVRPTSDVDLLVPGQHRRAAFATLDRLGFEPRAAAPGFDDPDHHEVAWRRRDIEIDLHMRLAPTARCSIDYPTVWSTREPFRVGGKQSGVLAPAHAAVFHGLHMAIDHFGVPAIYLVDLARLVPTAQELPAVTRTAAEWRCRRPLATALALASALLPDWGTPISAPTAAIARRVVARFGGTDALPRPEQLFRKVAHFDSVRQGARYLIVQTVRNVRERFETQVPQARRTREAGRWRARQFRAADSRMNASMESNSTAE